ncbi:hypothetical protein EF888_08490 [Silicimonas algicola]|uniref:Uncharacterized protein n=1 Tax=Silicimonas algicola TaxID=1826607 RepID=A0A316G7C1_9RHOB|nr:hypothetical protein [Silicimonas algicola]AZQ67167.1 hypothetical protein EF888_08490 [Silicimonas algicola]PWK56814.1 hypothetical protein C8D95_10345 [Silicimonas algicola]
MTKHIIDGKRIPGGPAKARRYTKLDSEARPHPHSIALQRRPLHTDADTRARRFIAIERRTGEPIPA